MRNHNTTEEEREEEEGDSWELARAIAEDAIRSTAWPPRCYTCSFCRREFRSAQALGGHMNVHRRDRARLHQAQAHAHAHAHAQNQSPPVRTSLISASADDSLLNCYWGHGSCGRVGTIELCPLQSNNNNYQLDNYHYGGICNYSESNLTSLGSHYLPAPCRTINNSNEIDHITEMSNNGSKDVKLISNEEEEAINEELDLELRLGNIPA